MGEKSGHMQFQNEPLMPQNNAGGFQQPPPAQYYPQLQPSAPGAAYPPVAQEMYQHQQPPPPYQAQPQPVQTVATVQPGVVPVVQVVNPLKLGPNPQTMTCPHCQATITTKIKSEPSTTSWLIGLGICLLGGFCCACIPCCVSSLDDVDHSCPQCKKTIGHYKGKI